MNRVTGAVVFVERCGGLYAEISGFFGKVLSDCEANESLFQPVWTPSWQQRSSRTGLLRRPVVNPQGSRFLARS